MRNRREAEASKTRHAAASQRERFTSNSCGENRCVEKVQYTRGTSITNIGPKMKEFVREGGKTKKKRKRERGKRIVRKHSQSTRLMAVIVDEARHVRGAEPHFTKPAMTSTAVVAVAIPRLLATRKKKRNPFVQPWTTRVWPPDRKIESSHSAPALGPRWARGRRRGSKRCATLRLFMVVWWGFNAFDSGHRGPMIRA